MNEFIEQFLIEGRELVDQAVDDLLVLENHPGDRDRLDSAFRAFHTLKGAAGIVDFAAMERALHAVEDALSAARSGQRLVTPELITHCLTSLDNLTGWFSGIEASGDLPEHAEAQADAIVALFADVALEPAVSRAPKENVSPEARKILEEQIKLLQVAGEGLDGRLASAARVGANILRYSGEPDKARAIEDAYYQSRKVQDPQSLLGAVRAAIAENEAAPVSVAPAERDAVRALRVDVSRIDALVKLTGELTTAKNAIGHLADLADEGASAAELGVLLKQHHAQLDRLVDELQRSVFSVRVLPMRTVFQRFPRLVRDIGVELGKTVRFSTEGEDTEADKSIVEALFDPMLHVIRNSLDHGIESGAERKEAGKPESGSIVVRAVRSGENVIVEVQDDGAGINVGRVRETAITRGVAPAESIRAMSEAEIVNLIFAPGFSTAGAVSAISGRGVGMDAVRAAIESLGGRVEIDNRPGKGAVIRFLLPFTLMLTRVMSVEAGNQSFGILFDAVIETIRVPRNTINSIGAAHAFIYRDRTVPVINLAKTLGAGGESAQADVMLVVTDIGGNLAAFEVDSVGVALNVMLTPLDGLLSGVEGIAGATLLGDGRVLIVLDLPKLAS